MASDEEFVQQFKRARLDRGWTMRELAAEADVSFQLVNKLEHGGSCRLASIRAMVEAMGHTFIMRIELGNKPEEVRVLPPPDRLAIASRFMAVLPRLPDSIVDELLLDISRWEHEHPPEG